MASTLVGILVPQYPVLVRRQVRFAELLVYLLIQKQLLKIMGLRRIEWAILGLKTREERGLQGDSAF
jgi:hypothetical protein